MKVILTPNPEPPYNLRRIHPPYGSATLPTMTEKQLLDYVITSHQTRGIIPANGPYWVQDETDLPGGSISEENDYFFDAWTWDDGVTVDMAKAREIHLEHIRRARNKKLATLDIPFIRALENSNSEEVRRITAEKQSLRDIPQTLNLTIGIRTPAQLKAIWPVELQRSAHDQ